jgi:glycosyltransferase involved in cell wall biosynthesis
VHRVAAPAEWDRYRAVVTQGLRGADAVVAPSQAMLRSVRELYGPIGGEARVIYNGSTSPVSPGVPKEPFVLAAGRAWDQAKNLGVLDQVAPRLSAPLLIAGDTALHGRRAQERVAGGGPHWLGRLAAEELAALRRRAAVFVAPARYEPFGLGILEAARDACALVLGDIPSLRELWGEAAWYVAPDDPDAIASALHRLLDDPGAAAALGRRAQERSGRYSGAAMVRGYVRLYRSMAARRQPRAVAA